MQFAVNYLVKPTGSVYFPVSEEHLPDAKRHFYVGISYNWHFDIRIPDRDALSSSTLPRHPRRFFRWRTSECLRTHLMWALKIRFPSILPKFMTQWQKAPLKISLRNCCPKWRSSRRAGTPFLARLWRTKDEYATLLPWFSERAQLR